MALSKEKLGEYWLKSPKKVVIIWLFILVSLGIAGIIIGTKIIIPGPASKQSLKGNPGEKMAWEAGLPPKDTLLIILKSRNSEFSDSRAISARESLISTLNSQRESLTGNLLFSRIETIEHTFLEPDYFLSSDNKNLLIIAKSKIPLDSSATKFKNIPSIFKDWQDQFPDFTISYLSQGTIDNEIFTLINEDLDHSLIYTIPLTLIILFFAFGSFVAAIIPLVTAGLSLFGALGVSAILSHILGAVSATASQLVALLVLAIGVDYSLFMISRVREEVKSGATYPQAISIARKSTGVAIFWSGITVALSLLGLLLMKDSVLTSMAVVSIAAVILTLIGCVYVLPSLLLLLGNNIERGRIFSTQPKTSNSLIERWLMLSIRQPILMLISGGGLILAIGFFSLHIKIGSTIEPDLLPKSLQSFKAFTDFEKYFPDLAGIDLTLIIRTPDLDKLEDDFEDIAIQPLVDELLVNESVKGPFQIERTDDETITRLHFKVAGSGNEKANQDLIKKLRTELIPKHLTNNKVEGYLGGTLPYVVDDIARYTNRTPLVFCLVLILSFIFLLIAFRSIVVPLKALVLNLISTAASFGILALLFQPGYFEIWDYGVIEAFVPALLFSILFGLSMDYHVFLLSRIREEVLGGCSTEEGVKRGILKTSGTITSAALIMVAVFVIVANLQLPLMKELGVGLGVAVLLDATIIRSILLPASMVLIGKWNWYLPGWLRWLPQIKLD